MGIDKAGVTEAVVAIAAGLVRVLAAQGEVFPGPQCHVQAAAVVSAQKSQRRRHEHV